MEQEGMQIEGQMRKDNPNINNGGLGQPSQYLTLGFKTEMSRETKGILLNCWQECYDKLI